MTPGRGTLPDHTVVASIDDACCRKRDPSMARAIELVQTPAAALPAIASTTADLVSHHRFRRARPSNCESPVSVTRFRSRLSDAQPQICPAYPAQVAGLHHHFHCSPWRLGIGCHTRRFSLIEHAAVCHHELLLTLPAAGIHSSALMGRPGCGIHRLLHDRN